MITFFPMELDKVRVSQLINLIVFFNEPKFRAKLNHESLVYNVCYESSQLF